MSMRGLNKRSFQLTLAHSGALYLAASISKDVLEAPKIVLGSKPSHSMFSTAEGDFSLIASMAL